MFTGLGAVVGLLGTLAGKGFESYEKKQDRKHELNLFKLQKEISHDEKIAKLDSNTTAIVKTAQKIKLPNAQYSLWVNNIRGLFRPFITLLLVGSCITLAFMQLDIHPSIIVMAEATSTFWFGGKAVNKIK